VVAVILLSAVFAPWIAPYDPQRQDLEQALQGPSFVHPLGTDEFGRDLFSRIVFGSRWTLAVGFGSVLVGGITGILAGACAGYYGGIADSVLMRSLDVLMAFPGILLALTVMALLGTGLWHLVLAVGVYTVPVFARITRSLVLSLRAQDFVEAARALGCRDVRILVRHILPNSAHAIIVTATLTTATSILVAASLSFLGIGVPAGTPEWGAMVSSGRGYMTVAPHLIVFPGAAVAFLAIGLNWIGDAARDVFDPKFRGFGS
jgi:peptide/nickel transport system permease protein